MADSGKKARINSAHQQGEQVLIDTIQENFGITINHYVEIDFVGFEKLVDAVGGITLWFDAPVRDSHTGLSVPNTGCVRPSTGSRPGSSPGRATSSTGARTAGGTRTPRPTSGASPASRSSSGGPSPRP